MTEADGTGSGRPFDAGVVAAKVRAASLLGKIIADRYRVNELIAMGGMGAVYQGEHVHMRKRVAIKVLHPETEGFPELVARFERESIVGSHVAHANVALASDFGKMEDGSCYLVTEFVQGSTLHEIMRRGPLPLQRAVAIAREIAFALEAVHGMGIVHRDLKPRNVMITPGARDHVKLIDFGLAKVPVERFSLGDAQRLTGVGVIFGTMGYMAPEAALGMDLVTERSDLYALGVILYEMLTGKHPYDGKGGALFLAHRTVPLPPFAERAPDVAVPARLEAVVTRLLEKSAADRFESAIDVVVALGSAMSATSGANGDEPTPGPAMADLDARGKPAASMRSRGAASSRRPWTIAGGAILAAAFVGALVTFLRAPDPTHGAGDGRPVAPTATSEAAPARADTPPADTLPSAAPTTAPVAVAQPLLVDGKNAAAHRSALRRAAGAKDWPVAASSVLALVQLDPTAFRQNDILSAAAGAAAGVEVGHAALADRLFEALAGDPTGGGADVLFELATRYGGSRGGARARDLLRRPDVLERATPALRIASRFRDGSCKEKVALLDEAVRDGDERTLGLMMSLRSPDCDKKKGECCMRDDPQVNAALKQLRDRLKR